MEILHEAPKAESFTPLAVYQSQTPESFFSGPPVLYHHSPSATLSIHKSDLECAPILSRLAEGAHKASNGTSSAVNGNTHNEGVEDNDEELSIHNIDIWVTSERLTLYSLSLTTGLSIPYPSITLHAIQPPSPPTHTLPSLFLQLLTEAQTFDDHDPDSTISLTLIPTPPPPPATSSIGNEEAEAEGESDVEAPRETETNESPTQALYTALSACANLHPDPLSSDDGMDDMNGDDEHQQRQQPGIMFESDDVEGGVSGIYPLNSNSGSGRGLPPPMPGSGGWITAENVGEFFDEEGNWRGGGGSGVGRVRGREEEDGEGEGDGEETKWRRTE